MSYYIMSDIHGCYDLFVSMLDKISFTDNDILILLGDYIDRGNKSVEVIHWLMDNKNKDNFLFLAGNHEVEFVANVELLNQIDAYLSLGDICKKISEQTIYFDTYGTIRDMVCNKGFDLSGLNKISTFFEQMPKLYKLNINDRHYIFTHAGYVKDCKADNTLLYDREETYKQNPINDTTIIHGHTPTIINGEIPYNNGFIHCYSNGSFSVYDIDCGCPFKYNDKSAHLACLKINELGEMNMLYL